jgi:hypothetical protein
VRYYTHHQKIRGFSLKKVEKPEKIVLSDLGKAILAKCENGADLLTVIGCGKPFVNKYGTKEFASTGEVKKEINFLVRKNLLERR